jgi:diguanylate cyclase (GGDEF)-like protein
MVPRLIAAVRHRRYRRALLSAGGGALGIAFALGVTLFVLQSRDRDLAASTAALERLAVIVSDQADRSVQTLDLIHFELSSDIERRQIASPEQFSQQMATERVFQELKARVAMTPQLDTLAIVDATGHVINESDFWQGKRIDVSGQDYFRALSGDASPDGYVGLPGMNPLTGASGMFIVQRFASRDGTFLGLMVGTFLLSYFEDLYRDTAGGAVSSIALWREDGALLVRYPSVAGSLGVFYPQDPMFQPPLRDNDRGSLRFIGAIDGQDRLVAKKSLTRQPIIATVSVLVRDVLHGWRQQAALLCIGTIAFELAVFGFVWLLLQHARSQAEVQRAVAAREFAQTSAQLVAEREAARRDALLAHEHERSERELREQYARFKFALDNMSIGLIMADPQDRLIVSNRRAAEFVGGEILASPGTSVATLIPHVAADGVEAIDALRGRQQMDQLLRRHRTGSFVWEGVLGRTLLVGYQPLTDGGYILTYEDVTERRRREAQIAHMAQHDALTDLPNRTLLRQRLEQGLARCGRGHMLALLCLDLDDFKSVNDTLGHPVGDIMLQRVAMQLLRCVRAGDTVARLGGDEFAIIQEGIADAADVTTLAQRLIEEISLPCDIMGHRIGVGVSIGVALAPDDGGEPDLLLRNADLALYRAKDDGRGRCCFFETEMDLRMQQRRTMELDLRRGLLAGEFEPYFQPLINVNTRRICGFEALVRWLHPERGVVMPGEFIALAEETGLIAALGETVLKAACMASARWSEPVKVAVNLSALQFKRGAVLVRAVQEALAASGLAPHRLELEITESVLLRDTEETVSILHQLRALGVRIAMDDFGTGYSSLGYLRRFPFDKVKIDQSFVRDLGRSDDCSHIVRAVIGLCDGLGISTTAEGVESAAQYDHLTNEGCTEVQGYLFGRAVPASEVAKLFEDQAAA